ncbi:MAG TPA: hypothetical protein VK848_04230 [Acidimicrobiia bacterium]|nr:hypothetical protein [Acidimicrobiia bacterium]
MVDIVVVVVFVVVVVVVRSVPLFMLGSAVGFPLALPLPPSVAELSFPPLLLLLLSFPLLPFPVEPVPVRDNGSTGLFLDGLLTCPAMVS